MTHNYDSLFIDGVWAKPSSSQVIQAFSASTEELLGAVPAADETDVDAAVAAARKAFDDPSGWSRWEPERLLRPVSVLVSLG